MANLANRSATSMIFSIFFLAIVQTLFITSALVISENEVHTTTVDLSMEDLKIEIGKYYWLLNNELTILGGSVEVDGSFVVTNHGGLASNISVTGTSFTNKGIVEFDALKAKYVSVYNISTTQTFQNTGDMYLGVSEGMHETVPFTIVSVISWVNTGRIVLEKSSGSAEVVLGHGHASSLAPLSYMVNNGSICLFNASWTQTTNIAGNGCIIVGEGSELRLRVLIGKFIFRLLPSQTINLASSNSQISFFGLTKEYLSSYPCFKIAGFGNGNRIKIDIILWGYYYNKETGILKIKFDGFGMLFDIGTGYLSSKFVKKVDGTASVISYADIPPNPTPSICSCEKKFPNVFKSKSS